MASSAYCYSLLPSPLSRRHPLSSFPPSHCKQQQQQHPNPIGLGVSSFQPPKRGTTTTRVPHSPLRIFCLREHKAAVITGKSWDKLILKSNTPVLVEFYASWCGPCRMVHRVIDEVATEYAGKLDCFILHADKDLEIADEYDIKAVPIVLLFKNGEKRESVAGTMPKEFYVAAIERVLAS